MRWFKAFVVLSVLIVAACGRPDRPIPAGTYLPESGSEKIVVIPSRIFFHVNVDSKNPGIIGNREYPYEVRPDGKIYFVVSSNSTFGLRLAIDYDWFWRDGKIVKVDLETGKTTVFAMPR